MVSITDVDKQASATWYGVAFTNANSLSWTTDVQLYLRALDPYGNNGLLVDSSLQFVGMISGFGADAGLYVGAIFYQLLDL